MKITLTLLIFFVSFMLFPFLNSYAQLSKNSTHNSIAQAQEHKTKSKILNINIVEIEPNNSLNQAQELILDPDYIDVDGNVEVNDVGTVVIDYGGGDEDDIEDLFKININTGELDIILDNFNFDCDIFLLNENGDLINQSNSSGPSVSEGIFDTLSAGIYYIGVSLFDLAASSGDETPYYLEVYYAPFFGGSKITISLSLNFGDPAESTSYRMIGLPGNNDLPLSQVLSGNALEDWTAYYDNGDTGDEYLEEYNTTNTFRFKPGNGFWILAKNGLSINREVDNVIPDNEGMYSISLHSGWNIISNPFNFIIDWSFVQIFNSIDQEISDFTGSYTSSSSFWPYKGYYFYNMDDLSSLRIPMIIPGNSDAPLQKITDQDSNKIILALVNDNITCSKIEIGIHEDAKVSYDKYDKFAPPGNFEEFKISIYEKELECPYKFLRTDYIPEIINGKVLDIKLNVVPNETFKLISEELQRFNQYEIFLLDERTSILYDLKDNSILNLSLQHEENNFKLLIGSEEFIREFKIDLIPTEYVLHQNYPNPFNPSTVISYSIPATIDALSRTEGPNVTLKIFDLLGREIATLVKEKQVPGNYEVEFNGSSVKRSITSGIYFYQLHAWSNKIGADDFVESRKMLLLK